MTTLVQDTERSTDGTFRAQVRAALARELPDILGEPANGVFPRATSEAQRAKRHAWATEVLRDIAVSSAWLDRVCWLLAGEPQIQAFPPASAAVPQPVSDVQIIARLRGLINDLSGVQAGE